ncbi:MAG TPA: hypothetical protein VGE40_14880 [Bacilli bacterium]
MKKKLLRPMMVLLSLIFLFTTFTIPVLATDINLSTKTSASVILKSVIYNQATNTSRWTYSVIGGEKPALSHWMLALCADLKVTAVSDNGISQSVSKDGSTGFTGLKFETPLQGSTAKEFWIEVEGNWETGLLDGVIKAGDGFKAITVSGPTCKALTGSPSPTPSSTIVTLPKSTTAPAFTTCAPITQKGKQLKAVLSTSVKDNVTSGKGTASFTIPEGKCAIQLSFSSYTYPAGVVPASNGAPFNTQIIVHNVTGIYGPGKHIVEINLPACGFHQLDLYSGPVIPMLSNTGLPADKMIDWDSGGQNNCATGSLLTIGSKLSLSTVCTESTGLKLKWKVNNSNSQAITFMWKLPGTGKTGTGTVAANSSVTFETDKGNGANLIQIWVDGKLMDVGKNIDEKCTSIPIPAAATPVSTPTPAPTAAPIVIVPDTNPPTGGTTIAASPDITVILQPNGDLVITAELPNGVEATGTWHFNIGGQDFEIDGDESVTFTVEGAPPGTYNTVGQFIDIAGESFELEPVVVTVPTMTGGALPDTASPWYNLLLIGSVLALMGALGLRNKKFR